MPFLAPVDLRIPAVLNPIVQRINVTALTEIVYSSYYNKYFGYNNSARTIYSSPDGKNWTLLATGIVGASLASIDTHGPLIAIFGAYAAQAYVWKSSNGSTFTETSISALYQFTGSFCDKLTGDFYAFGFKNSDNSAFISKTSDLISFTFSGSYGATPFTAIAFYNAKWIAYRGASVTYYTGVSYDTLAATGVFPVAIGVAGAYQRTIAYGNNTWIVCTGTALLYSTDAINWTNSFYANLTSVDTICFLEKAGIFIMGGSTVTGFMYTLNGTVPFTKYVYTPSAMTFRRFVESPKDFIVSANSSYIATGQQFSY